MSGINGLSWMSNGSNLYSSIYGTDNSDNNTNSFNSFFGNAYNNKNANALGLFGSIDLSNYSSLKNGSYYKLLKKYYSSNASADSKSADVEAYKAKVQQMADTSASLSASLNELMNADYTEENRDKLIGKIEKFVEDYNKTIDKAGDSDSVSVLQKAKWLTGMTEQYSRVLGELGIKVGSDNKLTIDSDILKGASMDRLKGVFGLEPNSFANKVLYKAEQLYSLSMTYGSSATAYTSAGTYKKDTPAVESNTVDTVL